LVLYVKDNPPAVDAVIGS